MAPAYYLIRCFDLAMGSRFKSRLKLSTCNGRVRQFCSHSLFEPGLEIMGHVTAQHDIVSCCSLRKMVTISSWTC